MEDLIKQLLGQFSLEKIIILSGAILFLVWVKSPIEAFIWSLSIKFGNRINVGLKVNIAGKEGIVKEIGLRMIIIKGDNGELHYIPNARIQYFPTTVFPFPKEKECKILKRLEVLEKKEDKKK